MKTQISNGVIILKKYEMEFAPLLLEAARESTGGEFTRWMPWCHANYTPAESENFIGRAIENWKTEAEFDYAIFHAATNKFVGGISLNLFNHERKLANMGYWVCVGFQRQGIAHAAARLLAETAFREMDLNRIEIVAAAQNYASRKTAEKAGAIYEGILRQLIIVGETPHDAAMFSFIRADFETRA